MIGGEAHRASDWWRVDTTPPTLPSVTGGSSSWRSDASVNLLAAGSTDAGSGIAGYQHSASNNDGGYWSQWTSGAIDSISAEGQTLVRFRAIDRAGNHSAATSAGASGTVRLDRNAPTGGYLTITFGSGSEFQRNDGTTGLFIGTGGAGDFSIAVSTSDALSGVASVSFPTLGTNWTGAGEDTSTPFSTRYAWTAGADSPGVKQITISDAAGNVTLVDFSVVADAALDPPPPPDLTDCTLTTSPLQANDDLGIAPLGNLAPSGHVFPSDHLGLSDSPHGETPPVYAPGDMTLVNVSAGYREGGYPPYDNYPDYTLRFQCHRVTAYLGHLTEIAPAVQDAVDNASATSCSDYMTGGNTYHYCQYTVSAPLAAGDLLGAKSGIAALDFGAYDAVTRLSWANPSRWGIKMANALCPIDLFEAGVRAELYSRFTRTVAPICGEVSQDIAGTAQGNWLVGGDVTHNTEDKELALVHFYLDPSMPVFSVGRSIPSLPASGYTYTTQDSGLVNRDFADITADGQVYCFEGLRKGMGAWNPITDSVLVTMPDADTLQIEGRSDTPCGSGPWTLDTGAVEFVR